MAVTAKQFQSAVLSYERTYSNYAGTEVTELTDSWSDWQSLRDEQVPGVGRVQVIDTEGGEGQGDHCHIVFKVTDDADNVQYFKVDGFYSSYDGFDWDYVEAYPVTPQQRTITVYER